MKEIRYRRELHAIAFNISEISKGTEFFGNNDDGLQISALRYDAGKILQNHIHKHRPRVINRTQECWVVLKGNAIANVFSEDKLLIDKIHLTVGDIFISYKGGHGYEIIEDNTIVIETKTGNFIGVEEDKEKF